MVSEEESQSLRPQTTKFSWCALLLFKISQIYF